MGSKERFSDRVDNYVKYRPDYPKEMIDFLYEDLGFSASSTVVDMGSGTGIFSKLLLDRGSRVIAVEPNLEMRSAAEAQLEGHNHFTSVAGTAEGAPLESQSADFVVAAQAFHWFDRGLAKLEFSRILKPYGKVVLIWNNRQADQSAFNQAYENILLKYGKDYTQVRHTNLHEDDFKEFFQNGAYTKKTFAHQQRFDFDGLKGRLLSSSYIPLPGEWNHEAMLEELQTVFNQFNENGIVTFHYDTDIYFGEFK
ncbi:class I SAM-dependent methyltransferase [Paenibacillus eucommiae]|uniref:SAM-dependent methyltransferase n=1 Tax=Paenibacillus eucommiae TaxID=1355755 RepID=A0ABS4IUN5_9BACL|nr:class I SAM-dependent methyltransferase [Paenibacillus eucommiae]MBP1990284.1 SAM-dependent methyltransferase [Paenibacillus eucommiae]